MNRRNLNKKKQTQYQTVNYALKGGFAMNRKVIYKNEDGEYKPYNMNDELLLKENGEVQLIRRAETPKDYFATFDGTEFYSKLKF